MLNREIKMSNFMHGFQSSIQAGSFQLGFHVQDGHLSFKASDKKKKIKEAKYFDS